jgi:hypothetical protein
LNREQLVDFIAAIPDLTGHRFIDTDDEWSYKIHEPREVAERVADALLPELGLRPEYSSDGFKMRYNTPWRRLTDLT